MSEKIITIHKTAHVAWQGTEASAAALGLLSVPQPLTSFEDTSHAYECGYLDGLAKGREEACAIEGVRCQAQRSAC